MSSLPSDNITYQIAWNGSRILLSLLYRADFYNAESVPKKDSFILAGNHVSFFDPPAFGCGVPREIAYFARKTLFKPGFSEWLLRQLNAIPVDRDGDSDIGAFKRVFKALKDGYGIVMFPEGTRSKDGNLQKAKRGVGMIACKMNATIVPARIIGSYEAFGRHAKYPLLGPNISICYGKPLPPENYDPGKDHPDRYQVAADRILGAIADLAIPDSVGSI